MSEVKRYLAKMPWTQIETQEHPNGEFVLWQDYARLKAEVERLYRHGDLMLKFAAANMPYPAYATFAKDWLDVKESRLK